MSSDSTGKESRNLVVFLDGTRNEPETGTTNVARAFHLTEKNDQQIVFYAPGVGTIGSHSALTNAGKVATKLAGLVGGYGVRQNIEDAYRFLVANYRQGDRLYFFGFSRGAYTARALTGMLRTVGLLRPEVQNMTPYALKLYLKSGPGKGADENFWRIRREFSNHFGNPGFPRAADGSHPQVRFLGVWDTVKSIGSLTWRAQIQQVRWPFTASLPNVRYARHAMAIHERRRSYTLYRFRPKNGSKFEDQYREMWFAGTHGDIGGVFSEDRGLSDVALAWIITEAAHAGLQVSSRRYKALLDHEIFADIPEDVSLGEIHRASRYWWLLGGWKERQPAPTDLLHPLARLRLAQGKTP